MRISVVLDCTDAAKLAAFWTSALGYVQVAADGDFIGLTDPDERLPTLVLQQVPERKTVKNRMHLDIFSDDFDRHFVRLKELGAAVMIGRTH